MPAMLAMRQFTPPRGLRCYAGSYVYVSIQEDVCSDSLMFDEVLAMVDGDIKKNNTNYREAISSRERLAICLRFLATGDTYTTISFSYRIGISTVANIVEEVSDALWLRLQPEFMPTPNEALWRQIEKGFKERWNFPHCIGAIDGKHVAIQAPLTLVLAFIIL
ncbi:protein ANTAGONIST OF LIKE HETEROCHROMATIN PROTEIN 1-like [Homalodisca vitripennis]|uniref:protein ANTAGONIST OF LIKE HETEROCHROMATIN PROTEIN 1-like n=1 Tax=Homalodisca vitripennis TaxID=197043 RepID=UPI001EE9CA91|nr:protein ANTAGONIST OF LIKE HETEROCHROMATIN PROTEIN 1-like [Homalodisca vitripennis]